jgi:hypothetical protein
MGCKTGAVAALALASTPPQNIVLRLRPATRGIISPACANDHGRIDLSSLASRPRTAMCGFDNRMPGALVQVASAPL